jgi:hypothetical protein
MDPYEQINNLIWIFLASAICMYALRLGLWDPSGPKAGFFPFLAGVIIGAGGLFLFIAECFKKSGRGKFWVSSKAWKRVVSVFVGFFAMAFLLPIVGYLLSSFLVLIFLLRVLDPERLVRVILTAAISSIAFYLLFKNMTQFPKGFLGF